MDLHVESNGVLSGLTGVFEHIVRGVLDDPRWVLRWGGWNADATKRTLDLVYCGEGRKPFGVITIVMEEEFYCTDEKCSRPDRPHLNKPFHTAAPGTVLHIRKADQ